MDKEFSLYIRRCHICDALNEDLSRPAIPEAPIVQPAIKCTQCGKFLAPFIFSDPEQIKKALEKHAEKTLDLNHMPHPSQNAIYPPLVGLAIYW
jgi:hypothetical protein